jgi:hypothetical protein
MTMKKLSAEDLPRVAEQALTDPRAVIRAYSGAPVRALTLRRIARAADELGLPRPAPSRLARPERSDAGEAKGS